jgi:hypothetical protein
MKKSILLFFLTVALNPVYGQVKQSHSIVLGFLQLKEQANLGMVFNGVQIEYLYGLTWMIREHEITYQPKLGLGIAFSHEIIAPQIIFSPVDVSWTMPVFSQNGHTIRAGANFAANYSWQMYPELQSGNLFWANEIGFSPIINYSYQWDNKRIGINIQNSLFGFTSHKQKVDPYWFYWMNAGEWIVTPHEDMKFGTFNNYNHTNISLEFVPDTEKRHALVYELDYFGLFYGLQFKRFNHSLVWRMKI